LRRLEKREVARFLNDPEPRLVLEAARAVNDVPINAAMPELAALIERADLPEPLWYRILNAHFRLGKSSNAVAVAHFATRSDVPEALRVEALHELGDWPRPSGRDRVLGQWRPLATRPAHVAVDAVKPVMDAIFHGPDKVRKAAATLVATLHLKEGGPLLMELLSD